MWEAILGPTSWDLNFGIINNRKIKLSEGQPQPTGAQEEIYWKSGYSKFSSGCELLGICHTLQINIYFCLEN
jgi:hypothetical protein